MNNKKQKIQDDSKRRGGIDVYAAQCTDCEKWRTIETKEEYEQMRSNFTEDPFICYKKPNTSCDDPPDLDYDSTRTWVIDRPNVPMTPEGFQRELVVRSDFTKLDAHYTAPDGKKIRCHGELVRYLQKHPELDLKTEDFNFAVPKIMEETIPEDARMLRLEKFMNKKDDSGKKRHSPMLN